MDGVVGEKCHECNGLLLPLSFLPKVINSPKILERANKRR
jgi:hypothetical protein